MNVFIGIAVILYFAICTIRRQHSWTTPMRLWHQAYNDGSRLLRVLVNLNHCHHAVGQYDKAEEWANVVLAKAPDMLPVKMNLAVAWANTGRLPEAIDLLLNACQRTPKVGPAWRLLGDFYNTQGNVASAASAYQMAAQLNADDADLHNILGSVLFRLNQDERASWAFERAYLLDSRNPIYAYNAGMTHAKRHQMADARLWFAKIPEDANVPKELAQLLANEEIAAVPC